MKYLYVIIAVCFFSVISFSGELHHNANNSNTIEIKLKSFDLKTRECQIVITNKSVDNEYFVEISRLKFPSLELVSSDITFSYGSGPIPHVNEQYYYLLESKSDKYHTNNTRIVTFTLKEDEDGDYKKHAFRKDVKMKLAFSLMVIPRNGNMRATFYENVLNLN